MFRVWCFLLLIITALNYCESCDAVPQVTTGLGRIKGSILRTFKGNDYYGFRGIRYAKAPVGDLRFKAPVPVEKWSNVYDATKDSVSCPTTNVQTYHEDCLFLNVYTNSLKISSNLPVIVYIHHGGFYIGSGTSSHSGPNYLLEHDVVLVTFNYRLGTLGFTSTGTEAAPGNAGLKDQVLAMRWVKEHIQNFGGNPNLITIFGYSAGALSASLHLVSPMSRDLFQRAVIMSSAIMPHAEFPTHQLHLAKRQAELGNCVGDDWFDCLVKLSASEMVSKMHDMFEFDPDNPIYLWLPVVETDFGQERFLTTDPVKQFESGDFSKVPIMTGVTKDELIFSGIFLASNETLLNKFDDEFEEVAPVCFLYERGTERSKQISKELRDFYLTNPLTSASSLELMKLFSDAVISFPVHRLAQLASAFTDVYYYKFSYQGEKSESLVDGKPIGVAHCDDFNYLLWNSVTNYNPQSKEVAIIERQTKILADFARNGKPFSDTTIWPTLTPSNANYLNIDEQLIVEKNMFSDRFAVWDRLFPTSSRQST